MKKTVLILALFAVLTTPAHADYKDQFRNQNPFATKVDKMPSRNQVRMDYTGTTSGHPIYIGYAAPSIATTSALWRICKYTDSADGPTAKACADDITWDDRGTATYT